jgi:VanZ family protein
MWQGVEEGKTGLRLRSEGGVVPRPVGCLTWAAAMRWGVCVAYVALVTWLSLAPSRVFSPALTLFPHADKLVHFLLYGFFVVVVRWALTGSGVRWRPQGLWVPLTALVYGALMEFAQLLLVPSDRSFEVGDMLANGLGALVFWGAGNLWSLCRLRRAVTDHGTRDQGPGTKNQGLGTED